MDTLQAQQKEGPVRTESVIPISPPLQVKPKERPVRTESVIPISPPLKVKRPDIDNVNLRYDLDQVAEGYSHPDLVDTTSKEPSVKQSEVGGKLTPEIGVPVSPAKPLPDFKSPWIIFSGHHLRILVVIKYMKSTASKTPLSTMEENLPRPYTSFGSVREKIITILLFLLLIIFLVVRVKLRKF